MIKTSQLGPTFETRRLILRPPIKEDFDEFAALHCDEDTMKFIGGHMTKAQAWRVFNAFAGDWYLWGFSMFSVVEKASNKWIGRVGTINPYGWPEREIGWTIHRDFQGKGYASEAAARAMDFAFDDLGWDKLIHCIDPANTPSQKVAQKLGSKNLGPTRLPPPYENMPVDAWGQNRDEWQINRNKFF